MIGRARAKGDEGNVVTNEPDNYEHRAQPLRGLGDGSRDPEDLGLPGVRVNGD
jgi:hypothetical protein